MGEPGGLTIQLDSEPRLAEVAGAFARALHSACAWPLVIGLRGDLGSGKTTWVRAMLRGLGYSGRVPSPTYTLLEQYACGSLLVVHLDLYRLRSGEELENLGLRDWLAEPQRWLAVEWPERAPELAARCDVTLAFEIPSSDAGRRVTVTAGTPAGVEAMRSFRSAGVQHS
jgi:tRNA threonylcarbamoyladenosine biosynthesis protein TsaE